jgi:hypothetical protein
MPNGISHGNNPNVNLEEDDRSSPHDDAEQKRWSRSRRERTKEKGVTWVKDTGIRMGDARKAGRKELAYGCRRSEWAPQANEPKRSAHIYVSF